MKYPIPEGACKAYRAFCESIAKQEDELEMSDFFWEREVADFIETLKKSGVSTFIYTNTSTAVMENLHAFAANGCTLAGLCEISRRENRWGEEETCTEQGIRFRMD